MKMEENKEKDDNSRDRLYQYLLCICFMPDRKTAKAVAKEMCVSESTVYENTAPLRDKGFLRLSGGSYELTEDGLGILRKTDRDTFDNLVFLLRRLGCGEAAATREALASVLHGPIVPMRRIANRGASLAALLRAGTQTRKPFASLPDGRHDADFVVREPGGAGKATDDGKTRRPAVFIVGDGLCALELYDAHIRRIAAVATGVRALPKHVFYMIGGESRIAEVKNTAGRWHIQGDAVKGDIVGEKLIGRLRVATENATGERHFAEVSLIFGTNEATKGKDIFLQDC
jgi:hypothetical protein